MDLHNQSQAHIYSATGIVNPMWQMRCSCHSTPGMLTASQQSLNLAHCHSISSCQFPQRHAQAHHPYVNDIDRNGNATELSSFQYFSPQLFSPTDSRAKN